MNAPVVILSTGAANLASVRALFDRLGIAHREAAHGDQAPADIASAPALVLPGVGSFGHAMTQLGGATGPIANALRTRINAGLPTLCICLGLQLLANSSEESPGVQGLNILNLAVQKLRPKNLTVPHMGWNLVEPSSSNSILTPGFAYFANSFAILDLNSLQSQGWSVAATTYDDPFAAAIQRQNVLACQFHPELSGPWGQLLVHRWLARAGLLPEPAAPSSSPANLSAPKSGVCSRIIPCLDVRDGRIVKGIKFQGLRDAGDPAERAAEYQRQGADELVILDVSATPDGRATAAETVRAVRKVLSIPLTVGGGVRTPEDASRLLDAGADKVGVNSAAVDRPELLTDLATRFGRQCVVLALDAARSPSGGWEVVTRSGTHRTGIDAIQWAKDAQSRGAGEILLTSWDRDGTGEGYDTLLLSEITKATSIPVIASGGAASANHLFHALQAGAHAVLAATIFHDGTHTVASVKHQLASLGAEIRS
jgi:imidazole glycerol-phosphate synthase subunit HisF